RSTAAQIFIGNVPVNGATRPEIDGGEPTRIWLAGGATTRTGVPKEPNVISVADPISRRPAKSTLLMVAASMRRTRPCWSTSTLPLTILEGSLLYVTVAVNVYRTPVQPG